MSGLECGQSCWAPIPGPALTSSTYHGIVVEGVTTTKLPNLLLAQLQGEQRKVGDLQRKARQPAQECAARVAAAYGVWGST